jgi:hypothetical protein
MTKPEESSESLPDSLKVDDFESTAREQLGRAVDVAERGLEEQPLLLGAVALGAGLAVGLGIPATQSENQLIGRETHELLDGMPPP